MKKIGDVLKEALAEAKPSVEEIKNVDIRVKDFIGRLEKELRFLRISANVFVGGSFAKHTVIKKEVYDVDIFVRFDKKYIGENISELTNKALKRTGMENVEVIHGSRDYFRINIDFWLCFEVVPTIKVSKPKDAENITDLSYYHVNYINRKVKNRMVDDIVLAKSFCHANRVYGAESHIKGFSGYSLELLVIYYRSFLGFLNGIAKSGDEKIIIDIKKSYSDKRQVMMDMNSSKLESPIILVDPTFKQRNALATLSPEVFRKFRERCREFLEKPGMEFFRLQEVDFNEMGRLAKKKGYDSVLIKITTDKQEGAIAGSKLLKFHNYIASAIERYFDIKEKVFNYRKGKSADCFFAAKKKNRIVLRGPPEKMKKEAGKFRKSHKKTFVKSGVLYAEKKVDFNLKNFISDWKNKNRRIIKQMYISDVR